MKLFQNLFKIGERADSDAGMKAYEAEKERIGGLFHFEVTRTPEGWSAQCAEVDSIMTGGLNSNPSDEEVADNIREAIHTAFNITTCKDEKPIYNLKNVEATYSFNEQRDLVAA